MRIAHVVPSLEERHGGPSKSVRALANALAQSGDTVDLLATLEANQAIADGVSDLARIRTFPRVAPRWLSRSPELHHYLQTKSYECIHHHSLWLLTLRYAEQAARRSNIPLVISPRGMMSGWAYQHRRWRKRISEVLIHPRAFKTVAGWHATSPEEAVDIRQLGFSQPVCVSPNGVEIPAVETLTASRRAWNEICPATQTRPVALFYSRFHRKKRIRELIDLWLAEPRGEWLLLIVGVAEEYTADELTALIAAAGAQEKIAAFDGTNRPAPYAVASFFVLPSHSENFGLVIAEALAAGVPTLVTDTTPWQGLNQQACGWCVPWVNFRAALKTALATSAVELKIKGERGRAWVEQEFSWSKAARLLQEFYATLTHG